MDWFERISGFEEADYASTQQRLQAGGQTLASLAADLFCQGPAASCQPL
jgi:hypothetical protein